MAPLSERAPSRHVNVPGEAGSYLRLIDSCMTQLKAQGPSGICNESKEEEEAFLAWSAAVSHLPPWRQPRGKSGVNSHSNATFRKKCLPLGLQGGLCLGLVRLTNLRLLSAPNLTDLYCEPSGSTGKESVNPSAVAPLSERAPFCHANVPGVEPL